MAEGANNAAIAAALGMSEQSVEKVIHSILSKLGLTWRSRFTSGSRQSSCTSPRATGLRQTAAVFPSITTHDLPWLGR